MHCYVICCDVHNLTINYPFVVYIQLVVSYAGIHVVPPGAGRSAQVHTGRQGGHQLCAELLPQGEDFVSRGVPAVRQLFGQEQSRFPV